MKRLTIRNSDGSVSQPTDLKWAEALEKLADYEDAEENGTLFFMPLKLGQTIYVIRPDARAYDKIQDKVLKAILNDNIKYNVLKAVVTNIKFDDARKEFRVSFFTGSELEQISGEIGKTIFLTEQDAQNALGGRKQ